MECSHCAAAGRTTSESPTNDGFINDLSGWWDNGPEVRQPTRPVLDSSPKSPTSRRATPPSKDSGDSAGEEEKKASFVLPSRATLSGNESPPEADDSSANWASLLAEATTKSRKTNEPSPKDSTSDSPHKTRSESLGNPPTQEQTLPSLAKVNPRAPSKSEESQSKSYGRSSEVQDAPLHDSWSSRSEDSQPPKKAPKGGLAAPQKEPLHDSWSTGESSQEQSGRRSSWAAALQAARESNGEESSFGDDLVQTAEVQGAVAIEDIPEEHSADPDETPESLPQPTLEPRKKKGGEVFFRLFAVFVVFLGLGTLTIVSFDYFTDRPAAPKDSRTPSSVSPPKDDATIWLASAQESLDSKDFKLAVPQLERAVGFLEKGEGEQGQLKKTQVLLATTYSKAGEYRASATLWTELAKSHPELRKKGKAAADAALRKNRIVANKKVKAAEKAVKDKKFDNAIKIANEALYIYEVSQAKKSQMARAHGILGDAYRGKQNTRIAFSHYTEAGKLDPDGRYNSELGKLKLPVRPEPPPPPKKPTFVTKSSIPQGNAKPYQPRPRRRIKAR